MLVIPQLLPQNPEQRRAGLDFVQRMVATQGALPEEGKRRLSRVEALFGLKIEKPAKGEPAHA